MAEYKDVEQLKKQIADFKRAVNSVEPMNSDYLTGYISALSAVEGEIAEQPAADVAPVRHAKWELIDECINEGVYCSNCHKKIYRARAEYANQKVKSNYCPNCGAKMDGKEDDKNAKL